MQTNDRIHMSLRQGLENQRNRNTKLQYMYNPRASSIVHVFLCVCACACVCARACVHVCVSVCVCDIMRVSRFDLKLAL